MATVCAVQQVSTDRYMDAHEDAGNDYSVVTRRTQDDDSQRWVLSHLGNDTFTIQQLSTARYVDAHESANQDWSVVTRTQQNNDTQRWIIT